MIRSFCLVSIFCLFILILPVSAQSQRERASTGRQSAEEPSLGQGTRRQALSLNIESRVLQDKVVVWSETNQNVSMPGVPVAVQLGGSNVVVVAQFTPYTRRDGNVLVVQGQIWIAENNGVVTYYTSMQTFPMTFGEPIIYFPLGGSSENLNPSIEIRITVNPYMATNSEDGR